MMEEILASILEAYQDKVKAAKGLGFGVSGNTFGIKNDVKAFGGVWDSDGKVWWMPDEVSQAKVFALAKAAGASVVGVGSGVAKKIDGPATTKAGLDPVGPATPGVAGGGSPKPYTGGGSAPIGSAEFDSAFNSMLYVAAANWEGHKYKPTFAHKERASENNVRSIVGPEMSGLRQVAIYSPVNDKWYSAPVSSAKFPALDAAMKEFGIVKDVHLSDYMPISDVVAKKKAALAKASVPVPTSVAGEPVYDGSKPVIDTGEYGLAGSAEGLAVSAKRDFPELFGSGVDFSAKPDPKLLQLVASAAPVWFSLFGEPPPTKKQMQKFTVGDVRDLLSAAASLSAG